MSIHIIVAEYPLQNIFMTVQFEKGYWKSIEGLVKTRFRVREEMTTSTCNYRYNSAGIGRAFIIVYDKFLNKCDR